MGQQIEQIARLILQTVGTQGMKDLREEIAYTKKNVDQLGAAYTAGEMTFQQYQANLTRLNGTLAQQEKLLASLVGAEAKQQAETAKAAAALNAEAEAARKASAALADYASTTTPLPNRTQAQAEATRKATAALADYAGVAPKAAKATAEAGDKAKEGADKAKNSTLDLGRAAMEGGRILQDFVQGGVGGILNNLEGAARALGGGPGLAGLMTGVGVAAFLARPYVEALLESLAPEKFDPAKTALERLKDRIKQLNEQPIKTAADRAEVNALERVVKRATTALEAFNEAKGLKSRAERESESATKEALAESGVNVAEMLKKDILGDVNKNPAVLDVRGRLERAQKAFDQAWTAAQEGVRGAGASAKQWEAEVKKLTETLRTTREEVVSKAERRAGELIGGATGSGKPGEAAENNEALARALEHAGRGDIARDVRQLTPKAMKANEESNAEMDRQQEEVQRGGDDLTRQIGQARQKRKQTTQELAAALDAWATRETLEAGKLTADRVKAALENAQAPSDAATVAAVMAKLRESYEKKVRDKALQMGGADVEAAQQAMLGDLNARDDRAADNAEQRFEAERERRAEAHRRAVEQAGARAARNFGPAVAGDVRGMLARGADTFDVRRRVHNFLFANGAVGEDGRPLTHEELAAATREIVNEAAVELSRQRMGVGRGNAGAGGGLRSMPAAPPGGGADAAAKVAEARAAGDEQVLRAVGRLTGMVVALGNRMLRYEQRAGVMGRNVEGAMASLQANFNNAQMRGR